jgi:DNA segregation ATPase FtsK/SpoIIIE, S-DNA-T family
MATYGPSRRGSDSAKPVPSRARVKTVSTTPTKSAPRGKPAPPTRREQTTAELRHAIEGREHEFGGIACIAIGVLLGLAMYLDLAGPLGSGIEKLFGWIFGVGRFAAPVAFVAVGAALIHKGVSAHRMRLSIGWGVSALALLGVIHVVHAPERLSSSAVLRAGGWTGALVGEPAENALAAAGAIVVLVALVVLGLLLVTGTSFKTALSNTGRGVATVAVPLGRKARRVLGDISTLRSERERTNELNAPPRIYDAEAEDDWGSPAAPKPRAPRKPKMTPIDPGLAVGPTEQAELELGPGAKRGQWVLPPANYLTRSPSQAINKAEVEARGQTLVESLNSHGVETTLIGQTVGPTVTRYELELGSGVKVAKVTSLSRDIAYAMAAVDVRILAPIPGRSAIGVEVPNHTRQLVSLGDIMGSAEAKTANHPLDVAIGKDIAGRSVFLNLATTPHLLIAGTTGAGKSSGINCILTSLLMRTTPDQVRLILIDPKQVEMGQYNRLPHLLTQPVTNPKKAANALSWAVKEMERRYDLLFEFGFRDIGGYNAAFDRGELQPEPTVAEGDDAAKTIERLPYIVVVVDELNDLMMVAARDVEESITRIAQKARAVGVHLIVATQRPSVNVITGVIKANIPARAAYAVNSLTDSRVILDQPGAEKLVGKGDMLLLPGNSNVSQRIQGSFVSEEEVRKVVAHWRRQAPEVVYVSGVEGDEGEGQLGGGSFGGNGSDDDEDETLMRQAMELVVRSQLGSTSMLQRKLKVGFARAGRIMDGLEQRGVVGPSEGSKARSVLMTVEEFELLQQNQGR